MMPSFFICHGAPTLAIEENDYTRFLQKLPRGIDQPRAIVLFSAHWESDILSMMYTDGTHETIYDFYGFPDEMYRITYPAKGSKEMAEKVEKLFAENGIETKRDEKRGLDHGAWVILRHLYPQADIPVIGVSVNPELSPREQYAIGRALAALREENVLIVGSGGTVHNLRMIEWGRQEPVQWTVEFDDWLVEKVENWDEPSLFAYEELAPHARLAVPRNEHFVPLFIAMGAGDQKKQAKLLHRSYDYGTLSMICFQFG